MAGGAPEGNQNAAKGRRWRDAVERAIEAWPDMPEGEFGTLVQGLNKAAHAFVGKMMAESDIAFFKEFGDRLDGKTPQAITGADEGPLLVQVLRLTDGNDPASS